MEFCLQAAVTNLSRVYFTVPTERRTAPTRNELNQTEYLETYDQVIAGMREITRRKNLDYATDSDAFQNFRLTEHLQITDTARGILVRMSDKFQRICNLIGGNDAAVLDEKIDDTLKDLANYSIILLIYMSLPRTVYTIKENVMDPTGTFLVDQKVISTRVEVGSTPKHSDLKWNPAASIPCERVEAHDIRGHEE